ncbi:Hypothetical protein SRAE_2000043100 [Strongyloides ratti]|uniref:Uncharacterized protein n=1 Tax=Strongyloides ratti TaxID=34506 RepID=A0A090LE49_STRRB|nr:Hypothetical protein SRAE_2000043100 [Strongyloides ratti]CEF65755.1 Hypothetical protein SRAE_2000043100 [Strongyloides ratti]
MSEFLCIILFATIVYLLYYPNDPLGIIRKFRNVTLYPMYNNCYHINDIIEESKSGKQVTAIEKSEDKSRKNNKPKKINKSNDSLIKNDLGLTPGPGVIVDKTQPNFDESEFIRNSLRKKANRGK